MRHKHVCEILNFCLFGLYQINQAFNKYGISRQFRVGIGLILHIAFALHEVYNLLLQMKTSITFEVGKHVRLVPS